LPGQDGPDIEEDKMHPTITQALVAERITDWRDSAARERLARHALRARRDAEQAGLERSQATRELARLADELAVIARERPADEADRRAVGHRAA
jgi:ABC-type uncharacterized transport system ATPase subunit